MSEINVNIVSAEGELFKGSVSMLFVPAISGELGIAPKHAPLLTALKPGEIRAAIADGDDIHIYVTGGILEIQPNQVVVLADSALHAKDLDADAAKRARDEARKVIDGASQDLELAQAQANLVEAEARYKAAQRLKGR